MRSIHKCLLSSDSSVSSTSGGSTEPSSLDTRIGDEQASSPPHNTMGCLSHTPRVFHGALKLVSVSSAHCLSMTLQLCDDQCPWCSSNLLGVGFKVVRWRGGLWVSTIRRVLHSQAPHSALSWQHEADLHCLTSDNTELCLEK